MSLLKESQLKAFRNSTRNISVPLNESLLQFRNESKSFRKTIFLSHKHDELENLDAAISFLKKAGVDIYVDWLDEGMPKTTSEKTAVRIKEKIKSNDKFILLASEGAISSKWCNWELGLGDAAKFINHIALLPIEQDNGKYSGTEYLRIYPYIESQDGYNKYSSGATIPKGFYIRFPLNNGSYTLTPLRDWLLK